MMMVPDTLFVIYLACLLAVVTALFLNVTGAILLWKFERGNTNQRTILLNLSICQAIISCFLVAIFCLRVIIGLAMENKYVQILASVVLLCFMEYHFIMMMMAVDRFIGTKYPLRHLDIFSKRRLKISLVLSWFLCVIVRILASIFYKGVDRIFEVVVFPILDVASLCCIAITYGYIMHVVWTRKLPTSVTTRRNTESKQIIKMTAIISLTFVLFAVTPDFLLAFIGKNMSTEMKGIILCCVYLGLVADPITYLLIRKRLRESFFNIFKCSCGKYQSEHQQLATICKNPAVLETKL